MKNITITITIIFFQKKAAQGWQPISTSAVIESQHARIIVVLFGTCYTNKGLTRSWKLLLELTGLRFPRRVFAMYYNTQGLQ